ncbi:alpha/beta hydrolase [Aquimarina sp. BL5]|uniref:alpha/beta hydrolase fold domain-containing protein n=1 Tax=Aquimarina sp. BL5 TaxID=1714860 RepID=UPI000E4A5405|nr:alpha/beta hydrolase [Aquimarina sp. BL5]AXT49722.1 alpha/beta hydrolase [Aquimarina sp. BL5]
MKQSFTYYLTLSVIKIKGLKKIFSKDPVDFEKLRKEDVYKPKGSFYNKNVTRDFKISNSLITEIGQKNNSDKLLIFIHGGAFISGPAKHHWDTIKTITKQTDYNVWMCNYPKAPEHKISEISENINSIYNEALKNYKSNQISLIGDSVGGTLIIALIQRLITNKQQLPNKLILVSPVMDSSMTNSEIDIIDVIDPMLSKAGLLSAKRMCAGNVDLKNEMISPLYGNFKGFPETILFLGEKDITYPDQKLVVDKLKSAQVKIKVIEGENMPHIWPFLPIMKEARLSLNEIIKELYTNT